ncbi:hypothetical protein AGMMS49942_15540 [Spirochaetia bacterium]|nr:hypothetical protein AGMMS49942_15540 [Spirochaetia bacterium]
MKHHHRDAVLSVEEITRKQFYQLHREQDNDLYWKRAKSNICDLAARIEEELEPVGQDECLYKKVAVRVRRQKRAISEREIDLDLVKEYGFKAV